MSDDTPNRVAEWKGFAAIVEQHIKDYTIPQYGDAPNDHASIWSREDMQKQMEKYVKRQGRNVRPDQDNLDLIKIAHYAAMMYFKELGK